MKRYHYIFIFLVWGSITFTGCDNYLDITPKGKTLLTTVTDYDQWMNDPNIAVGYGKPTGLTNYLADNVDYVGITTPPTLPAELMYTWALQFSTDINSSPPLWGEHYANINHFNTVLTGIDEASGGTQLQKRSLKSEALLARALEYFYLVNEYGKPYDAASAAKDPGVPFVTSNDVTQTVPPRSTVAEIYQHIIDDINAAIPDLPADNSANRLRGSTAAAYSVLARVYFYMGDYVKAKENAELALSKTKAVMIDLNGSLPSSDLVSVRPDVIYGRYVLGNAIVSLEFMRSFAANDLRVPTLYYSTDGYQYTVRGATRFTPLLITPTLQYVNTGTSVQEMLLIIAESAARGNELSVALQQLDEVRRNRFDTDSYVPFSSADKETVLEEVLLERYHELGFSGLRWFDMRRLDKENRMGTVTRYDASGNILATLPPHSDRYTLQIPFQVLSFNPGMPQNP
ncbi:RagB/SusD family nutrient uptake outer membrane protein [uncultured Chitinophaga sp.]|uniref:RagB/SusD family nutrient uptake outer membrane protein n=1 Tax=uncultured Chitinophaga sp. TaxID=339340 RepID=UPI0026377068|nr:RagB/SusD family nutrient uptake outer membrane protein [uncultured Chitinophaga sp.]